MTQPTGRTTSHALLPLALAAAIGAGAWTAPAQTPAQDTLPAATAGARAASAPDDAQSQMPEQQRAHAREQRGDASLETYVLGADQLVAQLMGASPQVSVGKATINGDNRIVFGSGSNARHVSIPFLQGIQTYPPANNFRGSTGVYDHDTNTWGLFGITGNGTHVAPDGSTWNPGIPLGDGIAHFGNGVVAGSGIVPPNTPRGILFSHVGEAGFGFVATPGVLYRGLQGESRIGDSYFMWGAGGTTIEDANTLDGLIVNPSADGGSYSIVKRIEFPELAGYIVADAQFFRHEGTNYIAITWAGGDPTGGGVQLYDASGIPTIYNPCAADLTGSGTVGAADLGLLLGEWGAVGDSIADLNGDGVVGAQDLAELLGNWGPCQDDYTPEWHVDKTASGE